MTPIATSANVEACPNERLEVLFDELAELTGQRNAIDGRIVEIVARIITGCTIAAASSQSPDTQDHLVVTDSDGQQRHPGSLARPPGRTLSWTDR